MNTDKEKTADEILAGPDYFYCENFRARLRKVDCVRRQDRDHKIYSQYVSTSLTQMSFDECQECDQGKKIREEYMMDGIENGKMKVCKKCGKPKKIDEFHVHSSAKDGRHYLCKECRAEINKKQYWKKKDAHGTHGKTRIDKTKDASREGAKTRSIDKNTGDRRQETGEKRRVFLEFEGETAWIYDALAGYAEEELRSIEGQAMYMLREFMRHNGMDEVIED